MTEVTFPRTYRGSIASKRLSDWTKDLEKAVIRQGRFILPPQFPAGFIGEDGTFDGKGIIALSQGEYPSRRDIVPRAGMALIGEIGDDIYLFGRGCWGSCDGIAGTIRSFLERTDGALVRGKSVALLGGTSISDKSFEEEWPKPYESEEYESCIQPVVRLARELYEKFGAKEVERFF
jgi:hypothetical protein